jgi:DNA modification methylase
MKNSLEEKTLAVRSSKALQVRELPLAQLRPDPKNPRAHSDKQVRQIANSVAAFGFNVPILIDKDLRVIAGHGRILAAKLLNLAEVPTICLEHLSEMQRRAFMVADNRLTENATWDAELLGEQLKILAEAELDFSLEIIGFEMAEIDLLIDGLECAEDADAADALPEASSGTEVTQPGDVWLLGKHRVFCGDALHPDSYTSLMQGRMAAAVFTDPPYNVPIDGHASGLGKTHHREFAMAAGEMSSEEFTSFLSNSLGHAAEHSSQGSIHYVAMDWRHMSELLAAGRVVYSELKNVCVWVKDNGGMGSFYRSQHELIFVFKHGTESHCNNIQLGQFGRYRTNVWNYPGANSLSRTSPEGNLLSLHPTVKPVALVGDALLDSTARGEIVLDPFLGSGTTVIAAERTGRICYGLELDPQYVDTIVRRWQSFTGMEALHEESGRSFSQIETENSDEQE